MFLTRFCPKLILTCSLVMPISTFPSCIASQMGRDHG